MCVEIDGQKTLFITPKDIFLNHYIFGTSLIASALRCSHLEKQIIKVIEKNGQLTKQELQRHLRTYNVNVTLRIIENHLKHLADLGYLNVDKPKRENFYSVSEFYDEFSVDPDFNEIVEYIKERMRTIEQYQPYVYE
jgi:arginine repressor